MAKNAGESRIPLPRTVRPSLLPKIRSLGPSKIGSAAHRRSPVFCANPQGFNNKQQQQVSLEIKQASLVCASPEKDKDNLLDVDYSISAIWNATADNKETDHLMRLNDEKLGILCSQEDLTNYACGKKKPQDDDSSNVVLGSNDYAIESPVTAPHYLVLNKQNSFEHDESSLGILTPDQMTDFTVALESSRTPSCENLSGHANSGKFLLGKSNAVVAAAARHLDIAACVPSIEALLPQNDRSPSLEELPLDPKPILIINENVDLLENTHCSSEETVPSLLEQPVDVAELSSKTTAIDSTESSEHTSEQTRCSVSTSHILPTSFITSVTSITSLEAGYQGDGENSRPASRGPEPLSIAPAANLIVGATCCLRQDPMTDSDFFTESDADAHEEIVRGDRRAQVIDGTLFCAPNERRCPSFEPGEEMDSSGIYSDLDKRQDSVGVDGEGYGEGYGDGYGDGDHTTDTGDTEVSMRSQPSPQDKPVPALISKNTLSPSDILNETSETMSPSSTLEVTVIKCQKNEQNTATKSKSSSISNKENSAPLKKYKMPKRNVISKIKTMIESNQNIVTKEETESEPRRIQRLQRKNGRWDAVMNKIEAGKQRGRSLKKEVKSRVLQGLGTSTSSTASTSSTRRPPGDANNNANNSGEKRSARGLPENSSNQETARSSVRSSASDLSSAHSKEAPKKPQRKNCIETHQHKSNISTVRKAPSIKSVQSNVNTKQKNATTNKVSDRNATNNRTTASSKESVASNGSLLPNNNHHRKNNNNNVVLQSEVTPVTSPQKQPASSPPLDTKEQEIQTDDVEQEPPQKRGVSDEEWFKRAEDIVQGLGLTVQYFAGQLENNLKELEMKTEWLTTRSELEDLRSRCVNAEEVLNREREEHAQVLERLSKDLESSQSEHAALERALHDEHRRADALQDNLQTREREHRLTLDRLAAEHEFELSHARLQSASGHHDPGALRAEVESLRTVLEIRSQENAQLRSEVDVLRREMDDKELVKQRCDGLEARCEDLKAQLQSKEIFERQLTHENEVLRGSIHQMTKQNKRLSQRNEELLWRLRQKTEVVSVLTNQLTPSSQRLSKSFGGESNEHSSIDSNCSQKSDLQSCSMVKYMVEKSDSVSWTLDITESMDCTSNSTSSLNKNPSSPASRRYHSDNNGVSRQGSLRLSMQRRSSANLGRARSNSISESSTTTSAPASTNTNDEPIWSPSCNSTPLQRRRKVNSEQAWSLSNTITESAVNSTCSGGGINSTIGDVGGGNIACSSANNGSSGVGVSGTKVLEVSTTDDDEEEEEDEEEEDVVGQRPQEAGGEAMISEETSASSSSEDDESSVSSGIDIP